MFFFFILSKKFIMFFFFFSSRRRHTRSLCDWSSDVCSSDLRVIGAAEPQGWEHQISNGGEPTFRYSFARVSRSWAGNLAGADAEMTSTLYTSVGYLTEIT